MRTATVIFGGLSLVGSLLLLIVGMSGILPYAGLGLGAMAMTLGLFVR
jgi:hypothetical protein